MLSCCNCRFRGGFSYVLNNSKGYYRRIEFGYCPSCNTARFRDYMQFEKTSDFKQVDSIEEVVRDYKGREALANLEKWQKKLKAVKYSTFANQNVYYGDFKRTRSFDENNLPVYIQLKKNFNNQSEVLNLVKTRVYYG